MPTGEVVCPDVVQSWVDMTWPLMLEYQPQGFTQQTIAKWWARVRPDELERASVRLMAIANRQETQKLALMQNELNGLSLRAEQEESRVVDLFGSTVKR